MQANIVKYYGEKPVEFAERLLRLADNSNQEAYADFNGTLMVAYYGELPFQVKNRWYQAAHDRTSAYLNTQEGFATISVPEMEPTAKSEKQNNEETD